MSRCPGLRRKNVTVAHGVDRGAPHLAGGAVDAARHVDGDDRHAARVGGTDQTG